LLGLSYVRKKLWALNKAKSEIKSYTVKSPMEIVLYGFIAIIILFGIPIIAGILIYRYIRKRRKLHNLNERASSYRNTLKKRIMKNRLSGFYAGDG